MATGVVIKQKPICFRPRDVNPHRARKRQLRNTLQFGTWNVKTMTTDGKVEIVEREMAKLNISCLGLSEVRWTGRGHFVTDNGSMIIYSGSERKHETGVGMILDKQTSISMLGYNPISECLLNVRLAAKAWNVTLIQVHAPTNTVLQQVFIARHRSRAMSWCVGIKTLRSVKGH